MSRLLRTGPDPPARFSQLVAIERLLYVMGSVVRTASASLALIALIVVACRTPRAEPPVASVASEPEADDTAAAAVEPPIEARAIAMAGDGTVSPMLLAERGEGALLVTREREGLVRYAVDVESWSVERLSVVPLERTTKTVAIAPGTERMWWSGVREQTVIHAETQPGDFPRAAQVLTTSSTLAHEGGLDAVVRVCPSPAGGSSVLGNGAGAPPCDHQILTLLPLEEGGVLLGGSITERVGRSVGMPWLGFASNEGTLVSEHRFASDFNSGRVSVLARSGADVLAVSWTGHDPARATFLLLRPPALDPVASAARQTPSWLFEPWSAAVAAPGGGFWVALATSRYELTILSIDANGTIASEQRIEGATLPISTLPSLDVRGAELWLATVEQMERPHGMLRALRFDPATGAALEQREVALPDGFTAERILALPGGYLLAGRVEYSKPLLAWAPVASNR